MNIQKIKEQISAKNVAEYYGYVVKNNKMQCPMHNDKTPSLSFKDGRFKCFSCGIGGSSIDLCMFIFGLSIIESCVKLNNDFGLGLDFKPQTPKQRVANEKLRKQRYHDNKLVVNFKLWESRQFDRLCKIIHMLEKYKITYAPKEPTEKWHELFCVAIKKQSYIEHLTDVLIFGTFEDKVNVKKFIDREVKKFEQYPESNGAA